jgi:hypothetical protein
MFLVLLLQNVGYNSRDGDCDICVSLNAHARLDPSKREKKKERSERQTDRWWDRKWREREHKKERRFRKCRQPLTK